MSVFFTSDTHFGHDRGFLWAPRGFESSQEHDEEVIRRWNEVVGPEDTVYLLGDLMLNDNEHGIECLKRLNGHINILYGNERSGMDVNNILSIFPGAFFIYRNDAHERIICANEELLRMFECENEEEFKQLTGNSFKGIVHPDDYERVVNSINNQIANSNNNNFDSVDYRIITKKGNIYTVHDYGHLVKNEYNEEVYYVFLAKDMKA